MHKLNIDMDFIYKFTPEERALLAKYRQSYFDRLSMIAELRGVSGQVDVDPALTGFIDATPTGQ